MATSKKSMFALIAAGALVCGFFIFSLFKPVEIIETEASTYQFRDGNELKAKADLIVLGEVTKDFEDYEPTIYQNEYGRVEQFYTIVDFAVEKVLKGDAGDTVSVIENAAHVNEWNRQIQYIHDGYTVMEQGKKYLLFLKKNDFDNGYWIMSITQGKFNVDNTDQLEKKWASKNKQYQQLKQEVMNEYEDEIEQQK